MFQNSTETLCCLKDTYFFSFLRVVSRKKFLRDLGVSLISDNRDNNFVEPCSPHTPWHGQLYTTSWLYPAANLIYPEYTEYKGCTNQKPSRKKAGWWWQYLSQSSHNTEPPLPLTESTLTRPPRRLLAQLLYQGFRS